MYNHCIQSLFTPVQYTVRELLKSILGARQGMTRPGQARQGTSIVKLDEDDGEERQPTCLLADSQSADTLARARGRQAQAQAQAQATTTATAESVQQWQRCSSPHSPPPSTQLATATGKHYSDYTHKISDDPVRHARTSPQAPLTAEKVETRPPSPSFMLSARYSRP